MQELFALLSGRRERANRLVAVIPDSSLIRAEMVARVSGLKVRNETGKLRELPLYDSSRPGDRKRVVYMVKALPDGVRLAFNRDYKLLGSVQATPAEWEAALIHSLDSWPDYSVNDRVAGDAVWFEVCGEAREPYRRAWIEEREWDEEGQGP